MRRILALFVDWAFSWFFTVALLSLTGGYDRDVANIVVLVIFWLESSIGVAWMGGSLGQLLTRIRVYAVHNGAAARLGLARALARQLLVCLVIPPLVATRDGRGLHDMAVGSAAFEYRT